jgi:TolA-binding protein
MLKKYSTFMIGALLVSSMSLQAESTVYGFGVEENTKSKSSTEVPLRSISEMRQKIMIQEERIDGLTTIIEGLSASLNTLESKKPQTKSASKNDDALLQKLAAMIDDINANYVTKEALKKALNDRSLTQKVVSKSTDKSSTKVSNASSTKKNESKKVTLQNKSSSTLYSEGVRHFVKHRYAEAKKRFTITDTKGYKAAASNYYLGEIAYYTKKYEDSIFYFKKSAGINDKASYIDTLLLHTAISLDRTGEKEQARMFYENIIANYPSKKTAQIAKDRVKKL